MLLTRTIVERWDSIRSGRGLPPREAELLLRLQINYSGVVRQSEILHKLGLSPASPST